MANIVQNAVGTQRQFTRQPVATYQKSLRNLVDSQGIVKSGAGDRLYNAVTGLGDTIMKYASSEEDRARARTVEVEPLINAATEDDWKKLSAIELLNKYGKFQLADNPYAVAAIEQARGKYMSEKFSQQYQLTMAQDPVKDPEKERQRYQSEKQKFLEDNKNESYDVEQFYKGFWASNPQDLLDITNQKVAEKSKSLETMSRATMQADMATYVRENSDKNDDEFVSGIQEKINNSMLMSLQLSDRKTFMEGLLEESAKMNGSPDRIKKCGDIIITNNDDGTKPVRVKDVIDLNTYIRMAGDTALARPNEWVNKQYETMLRCQSVAKLDEYWKGLSKEAQDLLNPKYGQRRMSLVTQEEADKRAKIKENQKQLAANAKSQAADIALLRHLNGKAAATYCTPDQAYDAAMRKLEGTQPGDAKTFAGVLYWSPNSRMRSEYKDAFQNAILGSSASEMEDSSNPQSVVNAIALYEYNPALFAANFGKDLASNIQAIRALSDFKGSPEAGFQFFCEGRDNMSRSEQLKQDAEDFASKAMSSGDNVDLLDADNPSTTSSAPISSDAFSNVSSTALKYLRACTQDDDAAKYLLNTMLSKNYCVYNGNPLPKAVFAQKTDSTNGIDASDDQYGAATRVMDEKVTAANAEWAGMNATWWWGVDDKIHFGDPHWGFDEGNGYTLDEFYDLVNQWWYDRQEEEEEEEDASGSDSFEDEGSGVTETGTRRATYGGVSWNGY